MNNNDRHQLTLTTRQLELLSNACRWYITMEPAWANRNGDNVSKDIVNEAHKLIKLLNDRTVKGKILDSWPGM